MNWLKSIVSTTLIVITGCVLAISLTLFYMVATLLGVELNAVTFGSMLAFSGGFSGVGYKQFKAKRETAWAEDEEGVAYRPGTRVIREDGPNERYNPGIRFKHEDFSDASSYPSEKKLREPIAKDSEPESEREAEVESESVKPTTTKPAPVEDEEKWEGDD